MSKLIGYARVSARGQDHDRQVTDLLAAGVRRDDLYIDHGASGALASRPEFDWALAALHEGDTLSTGLVGRQLTCSPSPSACGPSRSGCVC